jgi:hypothetical protein
MMRFIEKIQANSRIPTLQAAMSIFVSDQLKGGLYQRPTE